MKKMAALALALAIAGIGLQASGTARAADEVLSGNIREADSRTGQNTNTGSGIKTNHIQNGAVTSAKIKDGGVAAADIANNAVTAAKILDGSVTGAELAPAAVSSEKILDGSIFWQDLADGAVDAAKIADGSVSAADLAPGAVGSASIGDGGVETADLASGAVSAEKIAAGAVTPGKIAFYKRVIVVDANGGGDFTSPVAALNAITDASAANPYLVKLMPGVYDVGAASVVMKPHVDIEGSGVETTRIKGSLPSSAQDPAGVVEGVTSAELRFLTVENLPDTQAFAVGFLSRSMPSLLHVLVRVEGAGDNYAVYNGPFSAPLLTHVTAWAGGGGSTTGIYSNNAGPTLRDVRVTAGGGSLSNIGIVNYRGGHVEMQRVAVRAAGPAAGPYGYANVAVLNNSSTVTMTDVSAVASGSSVGNVGVLIEDSGSSALRGVDAAASDANAYGLQIRTPGNGPAGSISVTADRSSFEGTAASVANTSGYAVRIGASKLAGAPAYLGSGALTCVGSYDGSYQALGTNCLVPGP